jgi:aspartyl-tRNA(Asn)/glutamyl-tRNA(Gln) amidotransferase subunit C
MSKKLSEEQIVALARLAKLSLSDAEIARYQQELNAILDYVELLSKEDTAGLTPTHQVSGLQNVMREDVVRPMQAKPEELLALAPRSKDGYIQVGRMI